jgi:hypothetical protein
MIVSGYGRFLGWLQLNGEAHSQEHPGARATRQRLTDYLAPLRQADLADFTVSVRLQQLGDALKVMARGLVPYSLLSRSRRRVPAALNRTTCTTVWWLKAAVPGSRLPAGMIIGGAGEAPQLPIQREAVAWAWRPRGRRWR